MTVTYGWRGTVNNAELNALHAEGFEHAVFDDDWSAQLDAHSLGWVCATDQDRLVGFVNVAWDGAFHAFILDTLVARSHQRQGIGRELVRIATEHARAAGCEWLHADYDDDLVPFYVEACGFTPVPAGVIRLK